MSVERVRFGKFELDLATRDLLGPAGPVDLQPLPSRVLVLLVSNAGHLVTRDEIKRQIWGKATFAADQALNAAVRQVRIALEDSATDPRFVATVPRRGYRFVATIEPGSGRGRPGSDPGDPGVGPAADAGPMPVARRRTRRPVAGRLAALAVTALVAIALGRVVVGSSSADGTSRARADLPPDLRLEYLKGRELLEGSDTSAWSRAAVAFDAVRAARPEFLPATSGASHAALRLGEFERAAGLAAWAIAADSLDGEAQMVLGTTLLRRGQWVAAETALQRAHSLAPRLVPAYTGLAVLDALRGDLDSAFERALEAVRIDPMSAITHGDAGYVALWSGQPGPALQWCGHALDLRPNWPTARYCLLDAHHALGEDAAEREQALAIMRSLGAEATTVDEVAGLPASEALHRYRTWQVDRLDPTGSEPPGLAGYLAFLHMQDGDAEAALHFLETAARVDPAAFRLTLLDPVFRPLRGDPRLRDLLGEIKAPSIPS